MITTKTRRNGRGATGNAKRTRPAVQTHEAPQANLGGAGASGPLIEIRIQDIAPSPNQPRTRFDESELQVLADSMKRDSLLQPVGVRPVRSNGRKSSKPWELIWGERRLRAALMAGMSKVTARVCDVSPVEALLMTGDENLFRADWNPIETARYYARLTAPIAKGGAGMKDVEVAERYKCSQSLVSKLKALLRLPEWWQNQIISGKLGQHSARFIVMYVDDPNVLEDIRADMEANPLAWKTVEDVKRNAAIIADRRGATGRKKRPVDPDVQHTDKTIGNRKPAPDLAPEEDSSPPHESKHARAGHDPAPRNPGNTSGRTRYRPVSVPTQPSEEHATPPAHDQATPAEEMTRLAESFPSLAGVLGVNPWDADELFQGLARMDEGQRLAAQFCLHVWKPGFSAPSQHCQWNKPWYQFDVFAAFSKWDADHWEAFLAWTDSPIIDLENARRNQHA